MKILTGTIEDTKYFKQVSLTDEFKPFRLLAKVGLFLLTFLPEKYSIKIIIYLQCKFLNYVSRKYNNKKTFGGFLENRASLIGFLEESCDKHMIHLGIDINNIDPGTDIRVPCDVEVVHVFRDNSKINGWGGRLIMKMKEPYENCKYLLYGHLAHETHELLPRVGDVLQTGEVIAQLGDPQENGGWFPHLHVQCITEKFYNEYKENLEELDGYLFEDTDLFEFYRLTLFFLAFQIII